MHSLKSIGYFGKGMETVHATDCISLRATETLNHFMFTIMILASSNKVFNREQVAAWPQQGNAG